MEVKEPNAKYLARPRYKQTEVGVIPEDWEVKSLGEIGETLIGLTYKPSDVRSTGVLVLRSSNIQESTLRFDDNVFVDMEIPERIVVKVGDILICVRNGSRELIGKCVRLGERAKGMTFGAFMAVFRTPSNGFVYQQFRSAVLKRQINEHLGATINQITNKSLNSFVIPLPPTKAEQDTIAEALSDADTLIESLEQLLAKKRQLKQGAMQELLTGKKRLPGFSGEWEVKRLGTTATLKARIGWQGLTTVEYLDFGDYYLVTGTEFNEGYVDWNNCHYVDESRYKQDKFIQLRKRDVLVTKDGTIGKVALVTDLPRPATLNSGVFVIRPIEDSFHPEFFYYLLCSSIFTEFLAQLSAGSTINHLYQKNFVSFIYRTPPTVEEQIAIATILSDMDSEIAMLGGKLAKAREIKQGMMQELLTGRIRLVQSKANVVQFPSRAPPVLASAKSHNWAINEAVVISVLAKNFGSEQWPLGRKRYTKLSYLLHRHVERQAEGYLKKAAGPYNPATKYKGPEGIALKNGYVRRHSRNQFSGLVAAKNIGEAEGYFIKWYGQNALAWLEQFRLKTNDELELLATVDMAMADLRKAGKAEQLANVKRVIRDHPEWEAKLSREVFADDRIVRAMKSCQKLFGSED